jgi:hypothetical protein
MNPQHYKDFLEVYIMGNYDDPHGEFANRTSLERQEAKLQAINLLYRMYVKLCARYED